jgi:uncharacterized repeat protein (TIGR03803 family)
MRCHYFVPIALSMTFLLVLVCATAITSSGQTFTSLYSFGYWDGASPTFASLIQGTDGNLYGTTSGGGTNGTTASNYGTVFKITPSGALTVLHNFTGVDGEDPTAGLVLGSDGNFYGTTQLGGSNFGGTVFRMAQDGTLTTLYSFCKDPGQCSDGSYPAGALVEGEDGNFYGTTSNGGTTYYHKGTVFKITPTGELTTLYSFCSLSDCSDGALPSSNLILGSDGDFYGTTFWTVFKISSTGTLTTLHLFDSADRNGYGIIAGLIQAKDHILYGTASEGHSNEGTVFSITPKGKFQRVHVFNKDNGTPRGGLIQASDGNLYGTTFWGGVNYAGSVFEMTLTPKRALNDIYSFCPYCTDGWEPTGSLLQATDGSLYGTTSSGGTDADGTVFRISAGLPPFVSLVPTFGAVGATIGILGQGLSATTNVSFYGVSATYTVVSDNYLTVVLPPHAKNGYVTVTTASGTLTSNQKFKVLR